MQASVNSYVSMYVWRGLGGARGGGDQDNQSPIKHSVFFLNQQESTACSSYAQSHL